METRHEDSKDAQDTQDTQDTRSIDEILLPYDPTEPVMLVVGGVGVDTVVRVPALPVPFREAQMIPPAQDYVGHAGNGVARGTHALGHRSVVADVIGDDAQGWMVLNSFRQAELEFHPVMHTSGTRRSVVLTAPDGTTQSFYDPRHPNGWVPEPSLWKTPMTRAEHVHVTIVDWARHALWAATLRGIETSTDLHDWDGRSRHHEDFAYGADVVFLSAVELADEDRVVQRIFDRGRARLVIVTDGADGSRIRSREGAFHEIPTVALRDTPVLDVSGAGDSYVAAFLEELRLGGTLKRAGYAGSIAGAWACGSVGTHTSFADRAFLDNALGHLAKSEDGLERAVPEGVTVPGSSPTGAGAQTMPGAAVPSGTGAEAATASPRRSARETRRAERDARRAAETD